MTRNPLTVYEMNNLLAKLTVDNVMSRDVLTLAAEALIEDGARLLVEKNIGDSATTSADALLLSPSFRRSV